MRTLPTGSVDPNFGRRVRNRRQLNSLQNTWPYGYSMPIAVRYTQDAFSRSGWLWPVDAKGEPLKATSYMAVGFYVAKYVNKKSDIDLASKGLGAKEWKNLLQTKLSLAGGLSLQKEVTELYERPNPDRCHCHLDWQQCPHRRMFAPYRSQLNHRIQSGLPHNRSRFSNLPPCFAMPGPRREYFRER